jgi:UDPglucose 6-dehydrogenase
MRLTVIGAGTEGIIIATCLAETGHDVSVLDVDRGQIESLKAGKLPFYERGLDELFERNTQAGRLVFTCDPNKALHNAKIAFISVGTDQDPDGSTDPKNVFDAARTIGESMDSDLVVAIKCTVPIGTTAKVKELFKEEFNKDIQVAFNPDFFAEGSAVGDFMRPDRVIIGCDDPGTGEFIKNLYTTYVRTGNPILIMDVTSAEVCKLAANAILASRISFMNQIAILSDQVGADVSKIRVGVSLDSRIGKSYLFPGTGYGGRRFPRDVRDLIKAGQDHDLPMEILTATDKINETQKHIIPNRIKKKFGADLDGKTFALWGLSYKPRTDDIRNAPALVIIDDLLKAGAKLQVHDPEAMNNVEKILGDQLEYCQTPYLACQNAEALIIATEWAEYRQPDFDQLKRMLINPVIFDGRNIYEPDKLIQMGFEYVCIGKNRPQGNSL